MFSIIFVFYIWFHTGSSVISSVGMFLITMSLPTSALFINKICKFLSSITFKSLPFSCALG